MVFGWSEKMKWEQTQNDLDTRRGIFSAASTQVSTLRLAVYFTRLLSRFSLT